MPLANYKSRAKRGIPSSDLGFRVFGFILAITVFFSFQPAFAFSFAVFGDNHGNLRMLSDIFSRIKADKSIEFAVNTGDFVNDGSAEEYKAYADFVSREGVRVYNVMGNHDACRGAYRSFAKYFGPDYYSFDRGNAHFIVLDNSFRGTFDKKQFDFLESELKANRNKVLFVFFHKPNFDPSNVYSDYVMSERQMSEKMTGLFEKYRVRYVFTGHIHAYLKAERNGVVYIVTGGSGGVLHLPAMMGGFYHYIKVTVDGDRVKDEVMRLYKDI